MNVWPHILSSYLPCRNNNLYLFIFSYIHPYFNAWCEIFLWLPPWIFMLKMGSYYLSKKKIIYLLKSWQPWGVRIFSTKKTCNSSSFITCTLNDAKYVPSHTFVPRKWMYLIWFFFLLCEHLGLNCNYIIQSHTYDHWRTLVKSIFGISKHHKVIVTTI